jgi:hypothetical protein
MLTTVEEFYVYRITSPPAGCRPGTPLTARHPAAAAQAARHPAAAAQAAASSRQGVMLDLRRLLSSASLDFPRASSPSAALAARRALLQQQRAAKPPRPRRLLLALALLLVVGAGSLWLKLKRVSDGEFPGFLAGGSTPTRLTPTFTCPDGRRGLHVVHTRFLVGQPHANATFVYARGTLMNTFFVSSLSAQTSRSFVVLASYDPGLSAAAKQVLALALARLPVPAVAEPARAAGREANAAALVYGRVAGLLQRRGILGRGGAGHDLYLTSRLDLDDAVHRSAVGALQALACGAGRDRGGAIHVAYVKPGLMWAPQAPQAQHAEYGVTTPVPGAVPFLAILQTMIKAAPLVRCPLTVYSHPHTEPWRLKDMGGGPACRFSFDRAHHLHVWAPPAGELGSLYVRTATSSTRGKDKMGARHARAADAAALEASFGVAGGDLLMANLLFSGLQQGEAGHLLAAENARDNKF